MTTVYQEKGAIGKIAEILEHEKPSSILLFRGNDSYETCGAKALIEPYLKKYNFSEIKGFKTKSTIEDVQRASNKIAETNADFILAVGGGAVLDSAKAASILHKENGTIESYIKGEKKFKGKNLISLLIPTTSGTGAEITPFAVVYIGNTKYSLSHSSMIPKYILLDPELTYSLSPKLTAETGCDALAQAIESFWAKNATEESKQYSRKAIPLISNNLETAVNLPSPESRKNMLFGAHLAGKAIAISKTTAAHSLSYSFTASHDIPHGHAVFLTLPYFFPINEAVNKDNIQEGLSVKYVQETMQELFFMLGVKQGKQAQEKLFRLMDSIHLKRKISELGIKEEDLQTIVEKGFSNQRAINNPVIITKKMVLRILKDIF